MIKNNVFQYSKNLEGTKTNNRIGNDKYGFQYSKNLEGTKTYNTIISYISWFQYSKNLEGTKTDDFYLLTYI